MARILYRQSHISIFPKQLEHEVISNIRQRPWQPPHATQQRHRSSSSSHLAFTVNRSRVPVILFALKGNQKSSKGSLTLRNPIAIPSSSTTNHDSISINVISLCGHHPHCKCRRCFNVEIHRHLRVSTLKKRGRPFLLPWAREADVCTEKKSKVVNLKEKRPDHTWLDDSHEIRIFRTVAQLCGWIGLARLALETLLEKTRIEGTSIVNEELTRLALETLVEKIIMEGTYIVNKVNCVGGERVAEISYTSESKFSQKRTAERDLTRLALETLIEKIRMEGTFIVNESVTDYAESHSAQRTKGGALPIRKIRSAHQGWCTVRIFVVLSCNLRGLTHVVKVVGGPSVGVTWRPMAW
ncbi:hypothetical protein V8G54_002685 [Vigna mungo]|uniref:Uncharacterized protein n=1 Tax=Vigna mungo TaxID=3915 RepID=A0AAQ3PAI7_VIGMU